MASGEVLLVRHGAVNHGALSTHAPIYDGGRYDLVPLSEDDVRQVEQLVPVLRPPAVIAQRARSPLPGRAHA